MRLIFLLLKDRFGTAGQFSARQHDTPTAAFALQADIGSQAGDCPFVRAAWMRFAHTHNIFELQVWQHNRIIHAVQVPGQQACDE